MDMSHRTVYAIFGIILVAAILFSIGANAGVEENTDEPVANRTLKVGNLCKGSEDKPILKVDSGCNITLTIDANEIKWCNATVCTVWTGTRTPQDSTGR